MEKEKNLIKRYMIWMAEATEGKAALLAFVLITTAFVIYFKSATYITADQAVPAYIISFFSMILLLDLLHESIEKRFITNAKEMETNDEFGVALKVKDGKVIQAGRMLWGKLGKNPNIHVCRIPKLGESTPYPFFSLEKKLEVKEGPVTTIIDLFIIVHLKLLKWVGKKDPFLGFNPQELYDTVLQNGYQSIHEWVDAHFERIFVHQPPYDTILKHHTSNPNIYNLARDFYPAYNGIHFPREAFSNIRKIDVHITLSQTVPTIFFPLTPK